MPGQEQDSEITYAQSKALFESASQRDPDARELIRNYRNKEQCERTYTAAMRNYLFKTLVGKTAIKPKREDIPQCVAIKIS